MTQIVDFEKVEKGIEYRIFPDNVPIELGLFKVIERNENMVIFEGRNGKSLSIMKMDFNKYEVYSYGKVFR